MQHNNGTDTLQTAIDKLIGAFFPVMYASDDPDFAAGKLAHGMPERERERYRYWEWPQGVGTFALWKLYERTKDGIYLSMLMRYYDGQIASGLPGKNVNTMAPILALSFLAEETNRSDYRDICCEWVSWAVGGGLPRTCEGGFQHRTTDSFNAEELWDDTLMMTVLAVANVGRITQNDAYIEEAVFQFLLHIEYLADPKSGLWYHGFSFDGRHHFADAFWGRGNCWATIAVPTFLEIADVPKGVAAYLTAVLRRQIDALAACQDRSGMWHTLLDDPSSYLEASATAGFGYGILKAVHMGLVGPEYAAVAKRALPPLLADIGEDGIVGQVSYGTPMGRTKDFYRRIPIRPTPYGQATTMLFLNELMW